MDIQGKRVLLTGATGGIGQAIARELKQQGAILLISARQEAALKALADELGGAEYIVADMARDEDLKKLLASAGHVDILIANAGLPGTDEITAYSWPEIDSCLDVNLRAPILLAHGLMPSMVERGEGLLMLNNGQLSGQQVLPVAAVASIQRGGNKTVFVKSGYTLLPGWSYASMWWNSHNAHGAYAARGVHGQTIWVDPKADMVIVRFASNPVAANAASDPTSLPAYQAIAEHLMATDKTPLQGQEWLIEDIASAGIIDRSHASLHFLPDGKIAGSASCNRFFGSYSSSGKKLSIEQVGTTMMACPEALMNQESKLLRLLPMVEHYYIDKTGALILTTTTG